MALLRKFKEMLGIGAGEEAPEQSEPEVTVEREIGEGTGGESDPGGEEASASTDTVGSTADEGATGADGEPVESITGIGPAYAERLGEAGIETVDDLAAADPAGIAERTSIGEGRARTWIERARER